MVLNLHDSTASLLDDVRIRLNGASTEPDRSLAVAQLFDGLREIRDGADPRIWADLRKHAKEHDLRHSIHEDPMTRRSFDKPRGYAGDAVLLDYIYGKRPAGDVSATGRAVHDYAYGRSAACAVRHRKDWLSFQIDRCCDRVAAKEGRQARILSIACGHLREASESNAARTGALAEFVALDADPESLAVVEASGIPNATPVELSIGRLLARGGDLGKFDFVYSAGLYDYLEPEIARRLTRTMFDMLDPGGRLAFTNFMPSVTDAGYMETFMGWELIYRGVGEIEALTDRIAPEEVKGRTAFRGPYDAVGYCVVERAEA